MAKKSSYRIPYEMGKSLDGTCREIQGGEVMSRISSFYTLVTHLEKIADGTSVYCIDCQFFTDKEVACAYARMNKSPLTCEIIDHELGQLANIPDDVFAKISDDGNKELAAEYRRVMREKK